MTFTFDADAGVNHADAIRNPVLRLRTTVMDRRADRGGLTSESVRPLTVTLDASHPDATIHEVKFVVEKKWVYSSRHTILDLTDGRMVWPLPTELKYSAPTDLKL